MFLSGNDIRVLAITCSQGTLLPDSVYVKVKSLLSVFHHEGIMVGTGYETGQELPAWSSFAQGISLGKISESHTVKILKNANLVLNSTTENYPEKITLIALGSLKTYADWIKSNPMVTKKIDRIIWYNNPDIEKRIEQKHLQFWDDIVPLYLTVPIFFESETKDSTRFVSLNQSMPGSLVYEIVGKLLESATTTNNRVLMNFLLIQHFTNPNMPKYLNLQLINLA
jgi:hypothetical protein